MTATDDRPARIWLDLTQHSPGYTADPDEVREGDTEFVRADLAPVNLAVLRDELIAAWGTCLEAAEYLEATLREEVTDARDAERLARALRDLAGEGGSDE